MVVDISTRYIGVQCTRASGGAVGTPRYTAPVRRHTDYALARRAVLRDLERGRVARIDVCDAHPELLRAGRHLGEPAPTACPVCDARSLRYVSYVYGNDLRHANGRAITNDTELARLGAAHDEFARFVVEVCLDCGWNHLARRELHGRRHDSPPRTRRPAPTASESQAQSQSRS